MRGHTYIHRRARPYCESPMNGMRYSRQGRSRGGYAGIYVHRTCARVGDDNQREEGARPRGSGDEAAPPRFPVVALLHGRAPAAPPPVVLRRLAVQPMRRRAVAHEHARARRGLEHLVDALDLERGALLVRARADDVRHALALLARHVPPEGVRGRRRVVLCGPQVGLAAHENDRDRRPTDAAHLLDPLRARGEPGPRVGWVGIYVPLMLRSPASPGCR